jgi:cell division protein FtsX
MGKFIPSSNKKYHLRNYSKNFYSNWFFIKFSYLSVIFISLFAFMIFLDVFDVWDSTNIDEN